MLCPICNSKMVLLFVQYHCDNCEKHPVSIISEEEFNTLSSRDKRITLARDVIDLVKAQKLQAERNTYIRFPSEVLNFSLLTIERIKNLNEECFACALGSLFVVSLRYKKFSANKITGTRRTITTFIYDFFSTYQTWLIEIAFERQLITVRPPIEGKTEIQVDDEIQKAVDFGDMFLNSSDRLIAIMENIIEHGEFVP